MGANEDCFSKFEPLLASLVVSVCEYYLKGKAFVFSAVPK